MEERTGGYTHVPLFDGKEFARNGVVLVTVNYRLGVGVPCTPRVK